MTAVVVDALLSGGDVRELLVDVPVDDPGATVAGEAAAVEVQDEVVGGVGLDVADPGGGLRLGGREESGEVLVVVQCAVVLVASLRAGGLGGSLVPLFPGLGAVQAGALPESPGGLPVLAHLKGHGLAVIGDVLAFHIAERVEDVEVVVVIGGNAFGLAVLGGVEVVVVVVAIEEGTESELLQVVCAGDGAGLFTCL